LKARGSSRLSVLTFSFYPLAFILLIIEVEDDGRGMDVEVVRTKAIEKGLLKEKEGPLTDDEILRIIIKPGFTTVEQATDVSGRGVGMDVVSTNVSKLGGSLNMKTEVDKGTKFTIRLPLTLAIMEVFLVRVKSETYAIPLLDVYRHERIERSQIKTVGGKEVLELIDEEEIIPLLKISEIFDLPEYETEQMKQSRFLGPAERSEPIYVVVVVSSGHKVGLVVDAIERQQEIVIKSLGEYIGNVPGIAGATILGNGDVVLIIDVSSLVEEYITRGQKFLTPTVQPPCPIPLTSPPLPSPPPEGQGWVEGLGVGGGVGGLLIRGIKGEGGLIFEKI
jgi:two-component system chemotaxis sensor kinase CheA